MAFTEKAKKLIKSRAFFFKLLLTIVGLICIPLLAMQIFVIEQSTDEFQKSNQEYYSSVLQISADTFASREEMLFQTALRISLNETVQKPLRHNATAYSFYEAAEALTNYGTEILHVNSVGVYYRSAEFLLTNGVKYTLRDYCEKIEPSGDKEAVNENALAMETFFAELDSMDYFATSDGSILYAARPISLGAAGRYDAICFFAMDARALEESYRASVSLHASFAIVNGKGDFLLRGEDFTENISAGTVSECLSSGGSVFTAGDGDLLLYKYTDPISGLTFLLSVDKDASEERLLEFTAQIRTTMYIVVFLMALSLFATVYINYRPLHQLLKKHAAAEVNHRTASEIELLDSVFFKMDEKMSNQQNLLQGFILEDLLFGNATKPELVQQHFPATHYRFFTVMTALCPALTADRSRQLAERITASSGHSIYVTSVPSRPHTIIICLGEIPIDPDSLQNCTARAMEDVLGKAYPLCIGETVTDIYALRTSYRSAVTANLPSAPVDPNTNAGEFSKRLHLLSQCVYVGDEDEALKHLAKIKNFLDDRIAGEGLLRYYCFRLLHSYLNSVNSSESHLSGQDVELLLSFTGTEHLFTLLRESIHQVCGQVADAELTADAQLQQRLLQYVDDNFMNSELCLTTAATHVGTSIYTISRLFKEMTGKGFKDYVTEKRLEYGMKLLSTTQKSIAEVSAAAGFENANYFATVFKVKYGMPPTRYRKIQKENQSARPAGENTPAGR